jgi:hypothetical protein
MKKFFLIAVIIFCATVSASAQLYIGGALSTWMDESSSGSSTTTTVKVMPEIGYSFNERFSLGASVGLDVTMPENSDATVYMHFSPYARFSYYNRELVSLFFDGGVDFTTRAVGDGDPTTQMYVGIKPGVAMFLSDRLSLVAHFGFFGYEKYFSESSGLGFRLNGNSLSLGLNYYF